MTIAVIGDATRANARYYKTLADIGLDFNQLQPRAATSAQLRRLHKAEYVTHALDGWSEEWVGRRPDLGLRAAEGTGAALRAASHVFFNQSRRIFVPNAGRPHAASGESDRGCVFNDIVLTASWLTRRGWKVAVIDMDGLHAPAQEAFFRFNDDVLLVSVNDDMPYADIDYPEQSVYNFLLGEGSGDTDLVNAVTRGLTVVEDFLPDVILVNVGGTGHVDDELTSLEYTMEGVYESVVRICQVADEMCGSRVIGFGGLASSGSQQHPALMAAATHAMTLPYLASSAVRRPPLQVVAND